MACQTIAKVLEHSVGHPDAPSILTFQLRYPRIIHAESKTHRVLSETEFEPETPGLMNDPSLSRNARSSRAVPVPRLIQEVMDDPFIPRYWGANQKGMQAGEEHNAPVAVIQVLHETLSGGSCGFPSWREAMTYDGHGSLSILKEETDRETAWLMARDHAVNIAQAFHDAGYHKQVVNRLIEPFMHIDVVVTGTQWDNFFALRDHDMAEPHIRDLARAMKQAILDAPEATQLQPGQWHTPYVGAEDQDDCQRIIDFTLADPEWVNDEIPMPVRVSVTRCAQVSYTPFHEARLTVAEEVARHDQLVSARPMHASPAEHQATPDTRLPNGDWANPHLAGNLGPGWIQYRKTLAGECA